ncbi:MAG TPA: hypothetical protein VLH77_05030 [Gammaproteobacteria bacterium]|nr:hypothetical protein [Gammaproteobacteria bacterium]
MRKPLIHLFKIFWLTMASFLLYSLLLQDTPFSISEMVDYASHCTKNGHILVIGLLPIYLGLLIFGAALLFIYLPTRIWPRLSHSLKQWFHIRRKS